MKKNNSITIKVNKALNSELKEMLSELDEKNTQNASYCLEISNQILNELSFILNEDNISIREQKNNELRNSREFKNNMVTIENFLSLTDMEMEKKIPDIPHIRHNYYCIKNLMMEIDVSVTSENMQDAKKKIDSLSNQFENVIGIVASIIVSITIVTTSITAIGNIDNKYLPLFIISMLWFGMTFLGFCGSLFNGKNYNGIAKTLYILISVLELVVIILTFLDYLLPKIIFAVSS